MGKAIKPGKRATVQMPYTASRMGEPIELELTVTDQDGAAVAHRQISRNVEGSMTLHTGQHVFFAGETDAGVRIQLRAGERMPEGARVLVALCAEPGTRVLATQRLDAPHSGILSARLSLPELEPGSYSLQAVFKARGSTRLAEDSRPLRVLPAP